MAGFLMRFGILMILLDLAYLALWEIYTAGADDALFRTILKVGAVFIGGGIIVWFIGGARARISGRTCPKCRKRVAHGRIYCDEHRIETINRYRDRERGH